MQINVSGFIVSKRVLEGGAFMDRFDTIVKFLEWLKHQTSEDRSVLIVNFEIKE